MDEIQQLKKEIADLKAWKASLERGNSLPDIVDLSFRDRGFIKTDKPNFPPEGYTTNTGFRQDISLTGLVQTITVPAFPTRFFKVAPPDDAFYLAGYAFSQLGL